MFNQLIQYHITMIILIHLCEKFYTEESDILIAINRKQLSIGFLLYVKSNVTSSLKECCKCITARCCSLQVYLNLERKFRVATGRFRPSLSALFKCLILFAIMCQCQGRIQFSISALCQVNMLFIVYQDSDIWEWSIMVGTLD